MNTFLISRDERNLALGFRNRNGIRTELNTNRKIGNLGIAEMLP